MDLSAIRSRLAGSEGRLYWRSLGELADTPAVPRIPPPRVSGAGLRVERSEGTPRFSEADERLAGARRRRRLHPSAAEADRSLRPAAGRHRSRPSAVLRQRCPAPRIRPARFWSRATWGVRPRSRGTRTIPASLGAADSFTQAAILDLYDPDRAKTVTLPRRGSVRGATS